jgi:hypothetical protein
MARQMITRSYPVTHIIAAGKDVYEELLPLNTDEA